MPIGDTWFAYLVLSVALLMAVALKNTRVQAEFGEIKVKRAWKIVIIFLIYSSFDLLQSLVLASQ